MVANAAPAALELVGIAKTFGRVIALEDAGISVPAGTVHALLGENGAGKTTLMRIAYGLIPPDAGEIRLFGSRRGSHTVRESRRAGVGMVHQHLSLVPALTAAENLALGGSGRFRPREAAALLQQTAETSGLRVPADVQVRELGLVEQQRVEILKALARGARLLILDEPTAGLAPSEINELLRWIRIFADGGGSVVLVTHKLREALAVADHVTVLRRGRVTHSGAVSGLAEERLAALMFGDSEGRESSAAAPTPGESVIAAERLGVIDDRGVRRIDGATFTVRRGEIVGLAAVEGSGHRDLLAALAGTRPASSGTLRRPDRMALVPADRAREAIIPQFTLTENVALKDAGSRRGLMRWDRIARRTLDLIARFSILAPSPSVRAAALSGGNQQRLVIARELEEDVDVVIADEPTRGLDIRATAFVHERLRAAAERGAGVVFHSSDLDELLLLATRVLVVYHGTVREVPLAGDAIGRAMIGLPEA